jgi:hypothetical protein
MVFVRCEHRDKVSEHVECCKCLYGDTEVGGSIREGGGSFFIEARV